MFINENQAILLAQKLKENEIIMNYKKYNEIFGTDYTSTNLNEFVPHYINFKEYRHYDEEYNNSIIDEELQIVSLSSKEGIFLCEEKLFSKIFKESVFVKGFYLNNIENVNEIVDLIEELSYIQNSLILEAIHTMTKAVDVFIPIFRLIAIVLCIGIIFILVNFSTRMIKDKMHDIGILKAIGTQSKTIGRIFGLQIILIAILTILMSTFGYYYFIDMANDVLIESLKRLAPSHVMLDLDFLTFKLSVVNINIVLILFILTWSITWIATTLWIIKDAQKNHERITYAGC